MARRHFSNLGDAVEYCRKKREGREVIRLDPDLRLRSGEHAKNRERIEEQKKRNAANKRKKGKKNEPSGKGEDTGTA